jgi:hypothetical protein
MKEQFKLSEETQRIERFLSMLNKGDEVTYGQLSEVAGVPITSRSSKLISARKRLEAYHNQVWVCVQPHIAIRRLSDAEIAERLPRWWLRGARHKLKRGGEQAEVVDLHQLDIDQQARFSIDSIQRQLAFESLSRATRNRMERVARGSSNDLPSFNVLEWAISLTAPRQRQEPKTP